MDTPGDAELMAALRRVMHGMRRHSMASLEPYGLTPHQARAFLTVARTDEQPLRLKDLADRLHIAPRSATEVVDALEAKGLVRRGPAAEDRRAVVVTTTADGGRLAKRVRAAQDDQPMLSALTDADRQELLRLLQSIAPA
ncbi:MarR family winged helix-turn-helix transcriptional regulator [Dermacoccaceae bacterium W4C1]